VGKALEFAHASPPPPPTLAAQLEYPDLSGTVDYAAREPEMGLAKAAEVTAATVPAETLAVGLCTLNSFDPYPITYSLSNP
jgi:2-oxoisovalerate dehydrogenase E1 component